MHAYWENRRVLITGATGFLGAHLVKSLVLQGAQVTAIMRQKTTSIRIQKFLNKIEILKGDLCDPQFVSKSVAQSNPAIVFHLAASGVNFGANLNQRIVMNTNVLSTLNLLEACCLVKLDSFIYIGSCFEYGSGAGLDEAHPLNPTSVYAASKAAGGLLSKAYHHSHGLPVVILRPFTPYGPMEWSNRLIPHVIISALTGRDISLTEGKQERDYIFVDDVIGGCLLAAESSEAIGNIINLCSGTGVTIKDLVQKILSLMNNPVQPLFGDKPYREGELWQLSGDNRKAKELLGWEPRTNLVKGLEKTISWYQTNLEIALNHLT